MTNREIASAVIAKFCRESKSLRNGVELLTDLFTEALDKKDAESNPVESKQVDDE